MRTLALTIPLFVAALGAVSAPSQPTPLTIRSAEPVVVYGKVVHISGVLRGRPEGTQVTLYLRRHGESTFSPVSVVVTDERGAWSFAFEPTMRSSIEARPGVPILGSVLAGLGLTSDRVAPLVLAPVMMVALEGSTSG